VSLSTSGVLPVLEVLEPLQVAVADERVVGEVEGGRL